jgi:hypothetical protein
MQSVSYEYKQDKWVVRTKIRSQLPEKKNNTNNQSIGTKRENIAGSGD